MEESLEKYIGKPLQKQAPYCKCFLPQVVKKKPRHILFVCRKSDQIVIAWHAEQTATHSG